MIELRAVRSIQGYWTELKSVRKVEELRDRVGSCKENVRKM